MTEEEIISIVYEEYQHATRLYKISFNLPRVEFFTKTACAGRACYNLNKLEFNITLARENKDSFRNTIVHELAHLITKDIFPKAKQAHGPEFKSVMRDMGADPSTYHSYDVSSVSVKRKKVRFIYTCSCSVPHELTKTAHERASYLLCKKCKSDLTYTGEQKIII